MSKMHGTSRERKCVADAGNEEKVIQHEARPVTGNQSMEYVNNSKFKAEISKILACCEKSTMRYINEE